MVETGAILVPTRFIVDLLIREGEKRGMPEYAKKKIEMTAESHADGVALAIEKGVRIARTLGATREERLSARDRDVEALRAKGGDPAREALES